MGFKNRKGGQVPRTHSWSNHPDKFNRVCTKCGVTKTLRTVNRKSVIIYYFKDGSSTYECPECTGKSIYDLLNED